VAYYLPIFSSFSSPVVRLWLSRCEPETNNACASGTFGGVQQKWADGATGYRVNNDPKWCLNEVRHQHLGDEAAGGNNNGYGDFKTGYP